MSRRRWRAVTICCLLCVLKTINQLAKVPEVVREKICFCYWGHETFQQCVNDDHTSPLTAYRFNKAKLFPVLPCSLWACLQSMDSYFAEPVCYCFDHALFPQTPSYKGPFPLTPPVDNMKCNDNN